MKISNLDRNLIFTNPNAEDSNIFELQRNHEECTKIEWLTGQLECVDGEIENNAIPLLVLVYNDPCNRRMA